MHSREDSDRLSWALSALVVLIMGVAVGVSSRQPPPVDDSDARSLTPGERTLQPESRSLSRSGSAPAANHLPWGRRARL